MSNYDFLKPRERKKSLFIVEGEHEKDVLFKLLLRAFPEIDIREEVLYSGRYEAHQGTE